MAKQHLLNWSIILNGIIRVALQQPLTFIVMAILIAGFGILAAFSLLKLFGYCNWYIGILVDEATVTIENINRHLEDGMPVNEAIVQGASGILMPAFVSLLCICIVFLPMFFLPGISGFLFVPMALSVIFAMVASFILSRTVVLTMAMSSLRPHQAVSQPTQGHVAAMPVLNGYVPIILLR